MAREIKRVGVVGLGTMGAGIAQVGLLGGVEVVGREVSAELGERAAERIGHFLTRAVEKDRLEQAARDAAMDRLSLTTDLSDLAGCDLVVEAAFEDLDVKRELFAALDEVVRTELSSDEAFEAAYAFAERVGKTPIRCNDTPGFVVNRVLIPLLNDCIRVLDEARVSPEDLDKGMQHGAGWPLGPCALVDLVGIDVHVQASEALYAALREPRMAPPPRLVRMAEAGLLGRKTGRGFFEY